MALVQQQDISDARNLFIIICTESKRKQINISTLYDLTD